MEQNNPDTLRELDLQGSNPFYDGFNYYAIFYPAPAPYDSIEDTLNHIGIVKEYIDCVAHYIKNRGIFHDSSKLLSPEKECFDEITPLLKGTTYGSEEYKATLSRMKPAIDHHYKSNRHHPEYFENGIDGMNLVDLVEMICDWKAASERHADGNIYRSLEINKERFGISDQLYSILKNTADFLFNDVKEAD
nr:DUF5662 family protein [uncultured Sphaerochaeta sp.]